MRRLDGGNRKPMSHPGSSLSVWGAFCSVCARHETDLQYFSLPNWQKGGKYNTVRVSGSLGWLLLTASSPPSHLTRLFFVYTSSDPWRKLSRVTTSPHLPGVDLEYSEGWRLLSVALTQCFWESCGKIKKSSKLGNNCVRTVDLCRFTSILFSTGIWLLALINKAQVPFSFFQTHQASFFVGIQIFAFACWLAIGAAGCGQHVPPPSHPSFPTKPDLQCQLARLCTTPEAGKSLACS